MNITAMIESVYNALDPGVYIAMNGKWFRHDNVKKNKEMGLFQTL